MLSIPAFFRTSVSGILSCHLIFNSFLKQLKWKWLKSLCMMLVHCLGLTCSQKGLQYHSHVDFQLGVKLDSISLPDICTESSECNTCFCNSGSDLIINVHCSAESASQVGEFINNFQFLSIHSDGLFIVRFYRCWLVYNLCLFCADCEITVIYQTTVRLDPWLSAFLPPSCTEELI